MYYMAERKNEQDDTVKLYTVRGDRRSKNPKHIIKLTEGKTLEGCLDELGLELVGSWIKLMTMRSDAPEVEVVDVFPKA